MLRFVFGFQNQVNKDWIAPFSFYISQLNYIELYRVENKRLFIVLGDVSSLFKFWFDCGTDPHWGRTGRSFVVLCLFELICFGIRTKVLQFFFNNSLLFALVCQPHYAKTMGTFSTAHCPIKTRYVVPYMYIYM